MSYYDPRHPWNVYVRRKLAQWRREQLAARRKGKRS